MIGRRRFIAWLTGSLSMAGIPWRSFAQRQQSRDPMQTGEPDPADPAARPVTLFLCGDVMTGRGIDQVLPDSCPPQIYEPYLRDARDYVALAEQVNGPIPRPVPYEYIWGEALAELNALAPDVRIINLETAVTTQQDYWPKGINYRMHPNNVAVLGAAGIDCCALANNHVLDWGEAGLAETLATLRGAGLKTAGAGPDLDAARAPAVMPLAGGRRVLVFAFAERYSGVAPAWAATPEGPGIDLLPELSDATVEAITARVLEIKRPGDLVVASVHWGGNWGYEIPDAHRRFAHGLIDRAGIDLIHGHSSHHFKGIEVYRGRLVLYGCGDFLNDYEGIGGQEEYRAELGLMYFPVMDPADGRLQRLTLGPTRIRRFRIQRATPEEVAWQAGVLNREGLDLGTRVEPDGGGRLRVEWASG
jgi:poly-gamma-glutamate synthesis protein (capsule biosynthesis protein)